MTSFFIKFVLYLGLLFVITVALWVILIGSLPQWEEVKTVFLGLW